MAEGRRAGGEEGMSKAIQTMFPGETPWTALLADQCLDIAEEDAFVDFCSGGSCGVRTRGELTSRVAFSVELLVVGGAWGRRRLWSEIG